MGDGHESRPALWGLVDCNNFYVSCERAFRPDLEGRPVVVLSNNDGCIIARSQEAKSLGFKMGDPAFKMESLFHQHGVVVFSSNYTLYGDMSRRVMQALESLVEIEQYSIDECFIPFRPALAAQAEDVAQALKGRAKQWAWLPVSVGVGPTRTLAKVANHRAKKGGTGVLVLRPGSQALEQALEETPTGDVWGIGSRLAKRLERYNIMNALQLRDMDLDLALRVLTVTGQRTVLELRGVQCIMEDQAPVPRKTLVSSRSFGRRVKRKEDLAEALAMHAAIAARRLRSEGLLASSLSIHCSTSPHADRPYSSISKHVSLMMPTNITQKLIAGALQALEECYHPSEYMKGGIMLYDIVQVNSRQLTLLEACAPEADERKAALMTAMDKINDRFGRDSLRSGAQGPKNPFWAMRRDKKSPHYTTNWDELPKVT